jgi:hypothetical protein
MATAILYYSFGGATKKYCGKLAEARNITTKQATE